MHAVDSFKITKNVRGTANQKKNYVRVFSKCVPYTCNCECTELKVSGYMSGTLSNIASSSENLSAMFWLE